MTQRLRVHMAVTENSGRFGSLLYVTHRNKGFLGTQMFKIRLGNRDKKKKKKRRHLTLCGRLLENTQLPYECDFVEY